MAIASALLATLLCASCALPASAKSVTFSDVPNSSWYGGESGCAGAIDGAYFIATLN
ncbi:MAG: hypothetical protein IJC51_00835 [Eggerthellaceae bacterium]|nr:hypothetical protein [Eggerthellaceae bacterium]